MLLSIDGASAEPDEYCLRNEAFANVLTLVTLPDASPKAFLDAAADFCNTKVTLSDASPEAFFDGAADFCNTTVLDTRWIY
ncbi:hypothetical protein T484DRAFT_1809045 [Baffinella frigidus]|nr:hypothetical protein T484DRAFT_1809045 [Cryptophyta sp. CCMP2293]